MSDSILKSPLDYDMMEEDDSVFLNAIPLSILKDSIETQFNEPFEYRKKDYIMEYIKKYNYSKEYQNEVDEELEPLEVLHDEFITFIARIFDKYLDIGFVNLLDESVESQCDIIHMTYKYFIKNIKKNFTLIIKNEIEYNKDEIVRDIDRKKDVTYRAFKREIEDEDYVLILSNLDVVVEKIIDKIINEYTVDKFLEMTDPGEYDPNYEFVKKAYNASDNLLVGNFIEKYCKMIDPIFMIDIESKVRNYILKKFPDREYKDIENDENNNQVEMDNNDI